MPELSNGLFQIYRRVDGARFHGHLTSSQAVNTKEKAPYRVMHVRRPTFISAGDTIITRGAEVVILMEHPDDFDWAASYKAVYALEQLDWSREIFTIDSVSKSKKSNGYQSMGSLYVNFDTPEEIRLEGLSDTKYRFITGQDVHVGDKVGEYFVKRIVKSLGVKVVYAT